MDEQLVTTLRQLVEQYGAKAVVEALHQGLGLTAVMTWAGATPEEMAGVMTWAGADPEQMASVMTWAGAAPEPAAVMTWAGGSPEDGSLARALQQLVDQHGAGPVVAALRDVVNLAAVMTWAGATPDDMASVMTWAGLSPEEHDQTPAGVMTWAGAPADKQAKTQLPDAIVEMAKGVKTA